MALTHARLMQVMSVLQSMSVVHPDTARARFSQNASLHVSSSPQSLLLLQSPVKLKEHGVSSTEMAYVILQTTKIEAGCLGPLAPPYYPMIQIVNIKNSCCIALGWGLCIK